MFARAVNNDGKCKQTKPTTPALANPSVPKKTQLSLDDTIQSQSSVPASARRSNALTPSQPSVLNEPPRPEPTLSRQPVEQRDRLTNALNRQYSFGDCLSPPMVKGNLQTPQKPIDALHGAIDFVEEEYEFKDDLDEIDPELMGQVLASCVPSATSSFERPVYKATSPISAKQVATSPKKVSQQMRPIFEPPSSSAPFPWSSSPAEHYAPPVLPVKRREPPVHTIPEEQNEDATIPPEEDCRPIKRRLLPWSKDGLKKESPMEQARPKKAPTEQASPLKAPTEQARPSKAPMQQARPSKAPTSRVSASRATNKKEKAPETWINSFANADHRTLQKELRVKNSVQKRTFSSVADPQEAALIKKKNIRPASIFLSDEQRHVLNLVQIGRKSVFFTGSAGTGKSVLLREIIADLRRKYSSEEGRVAVTASTGLAACNIGGVTLHSFAGIGLGKEPVPDLVRKIKRNIKAKNRWLRTKVLVIDEISMVDGDLFDKLEQIARQIRNNGRVFGGIQLVITGDFFQLPPVPEGKKVAKFAFDADSWTLAIEHTIGLSHVFRQKDPVFAGMLNEMRLGKLSANTINNFKSLHRPIGYNDGLEATELFPTRQEVDAANNSRLRKLTGEVQTFIADDSGTVTDPQFREKLLSNCMAPPKIELKINSQVMLIKNMDDSLVNGSLGRVVAFMDDRTFDLMFEGTGETDPDEEETKAAPIGKAKLSTAKIWPLVQFSLPDGTTRQLLVQPEQWKIELPNGEVQACRTQIPLILAWALSIHKAQGQTLERVKVDLGRVFEKGQAYVALSRATCQEGLQVLRFDEKKVMAHEKVRGFYSSLSTAKEALKTSSTRASSITTTATSSFRTAKSSATSQEMDESQVMREMHG